ncbi:MutS-related protein [Pedobacter psychroterrae]|uniref:DNA mismatch repair protein n=1 Tax=Pedobacter psychroterrae TaxID=2530453 RepID=A0A4R0N9H6_9SPHI|nr:DNA mismatch repair protein [Pedobacter psychroterrae]TCC96859.1 DNA mismatch repair protein [Pedobacter psychroterrae]
MLLQTDSQTIEDLRLFSRQDQKGIYELYNNTFTRGGEELLESMFRGPLSDLEAIRSRAAIIGAFGKLKTRFPFEGWLLDNVEKYMLQAKELNEGKKPDLSEKETAAGVGAVIELFHLLREFLEKGDLKNITGLENERAEVMSVLNEVSLTPVFKEQAKAKLSYAASTAYDVLFRVREKEKVIRVLQFIYLIDVYISVANVAGKYNFVFPVPQPKHSGVLDLEGVYHPELKNPVANSLSMNADKTVVFLTGANMAGKSTFLRSFSTALYVAHMGFPVAAKRMEFAVMDGIYTTINLPDNLGIGASHFYAEVLRVKKMAIELGSGKSIFVLFDELFRGTNVKDAHEGTVEVTRAFAEMKTSRFIISSHIVEAAAELCKKENIGFHYLPTVMNGAMPVYTYTLKEGVTDDRHGMIIIRNEGILETLKNGNKNG